MDDVIYVIHEQKWTIFVKSAKSFHQQIVGLFFFQAVNRGFQSYQWLLSLSYGRLVVVLTVFNTFNEGLNPAVITLVQHHKRISIQELQLKNTNCSLAAVGTTVSVWAHFVFSLVCICYRVG